MATPRIERQFVEFMACGRQLAARSSASILKIVCFDEHDLGWAKRVAASLPGRSADPLGRNAGPAPGPVREAVGDRYRWLCERVAADPELGDARVLPQLHVIAWKEARGV